MNKKTFTVNYRQEGMRLVDVVADELGISKKQAKSLLDAKQVFVNRQRVWMTKHAVKEDDEIEVALVAAPSPAAPSAIQVLWHDADYLIANKPPYLLANAADGSVEALLRAQRKNPEILAVHRLDRETSGCLLFANSAEAKAAAIPMFEGRDIMKIYRAITIGQFPKSWSDIRTDIDGFMSTTLVKLLDSNKHASYLELRIETGRTHQIRRHLADKRYPVLGDKKYAGTGSELSLEQPRQMLHAYRLVFPHPRTGETIRATAPLPADFKRCLAQLKLQ